MGEFQEKLERNYRPEKQEVLSICYEDIEGEIKGGEKQIYGSQTLGTQEWYMVCNHPILLVGTSRFIGSFINSSSHSFINLFSTATFMLDTVQILQNQSTILGFRFQLHSGKYLSSLVQGIAHLYSQHLKYQIKRPQPSPTAKSLLLNFKTQQ